MAAVTFHSDFGSQENKVCYCFHCFHFICHKVMGPDTMIFVSWMLSFKPAFSFFSFTFIKRLFSSSLSAIRVVLSACLRLLISLLAFWLQHVLYQFYTLCYKEVGILPMFKNSCCIPSCIESQYFTKRKYLSQESLWEHDFIISLVLLASCLSHLNYHFYHLTISFSHQREMKSHMQGPALTVSVNV